MKYVRELKAGDVVRFNYGIDNFIKAVVLDVDVHQTWTKVKFMAYGQTKARTTWLYTDAGIEWFGIMNRRQVTKWTAKEKGEGK